MSESEFGGGGGGARGKSNAVGANGERGRLSVPVAPAWEESSAEKSPGGRRRRASRDGEERRRSEDLFEELLTNVERGAPDASGTQGQEAARLPRKDFVEWSLRVLNPYCRPPVVLDALRKLVRAASAGDLNEVGSSTRKGLEQMSILGAEAANLALKCLATGGVYIGGGIPPRLMAIIEKGGLLEGYLHKACRYTGVREGFPLHIILNDKIGLAGAKVYAMRQL